MKELEIRKLTILQNNTAGRVEIGAITQVARAPYKFRIHLYNMRGNSMVIHRATFAEAERWLIKNFDKAAMMLGLAKTKTFEGI
jgi:hypothetical protein